MGNSVTRFFGLVCLLVFVPIAAWPKSLALVIGHNGSLDSTTPPLRYADDDAFQYARLFFELGAEVTLLVDPDPSTAKLYANMTPDGPPTQEAIVEALIALKQQTDADKVDFYFVYAGHGDVRHGEGHITLQDGPLSRTEFFENILARIPGRTQHIIIDACKSYFLVFDRGDTEIRTPYENPFEHANEFNHKPTVGFFLSTSSSENSHEWEAFQAGVFSHEIRSGLRGAADVNGDNRISYRELAGFVHLANSSIPNEKYRPNFLAMPPVDHDTLVTLDAYQAAPLLLDVEVSHHFYVEDPEGVRLLDMRPEQHALSLYLPQGRHLFLHDQDLHKEYVLPHSGRVLLSNLSPQTPRSTARGAAHEAFKRLFATPFGKRAYATLPLDSSYKERPRFVSQTLAKPQSSLSKWMWVGAATAVVSGALGTTFWMLGSQKFDQYKDARANNQSKLRKDIERLDAAAWSSFAMCGVSAALTTALWIWFDNDET